MTTLTAISLFAGIGGFDLGLQRAGIETVVQVEIEKKQRSVLARHFPDATRLEDVRHVGRHNLPTIDLICGGSPCQDVSVAGKRAGLVGQRSRLFFEFVRILAEVNSTWVLFENVDGLLFSNGGRDFATVLFYLGQCGYRLAWRVFDTQYFGVPQRRERVFIIGHSRNGSAANVLFEPDPEFLETPQKQMVSPTLTTQGQVDNGGGGWTHGLVIHDDKGLRGLTPIECERLQGFPDNWTAYGENNEPMSDSARYGMLGNAVSVPVAEWIARRIVECEATS